METLEIFKDANLRKPIENKKICPHCGSYDVSNDHCRDCGKRAKFDPVGEPFSSRSFYTLLEKYQTTVRKTVFGNFRTSLNKPLALSLKRRAILLSELLKAEVEHPHRKVFAMEFSLVLEELCRIGHTIDLTRENLWVLVDGLEGSAFYEQLVLPLLDDKIRPKKVSVAVSQFLDRRFFETFSYRQLLIGAVSITTLAFLILAWSSMAQLAV